MRGREEARSLLASCYHLPAQGLGRRPREEGDGSCTQLALCPQGSTSPLQASPQCPPTPFPNATVSPHSEHARQRAGRALQPGSETPILHARLSHLLGGWNRLVTVLSRFERDIFLPQKQLDCTQPTAAQPSPARSQRALQGGEGMYSPVL